MYLVNFNWFDFLIVLVIFLVMSPKKNLLNYVSDPKKNPTTAIFIGVIACLSYIILFFARVGTSSIATYAIPISVAYALISPGVLFEYSKLTGLARESEKEISFNDMFIHSLFMVLAVLMIHNINRCTTGPVGGCKPQFDVFKNIF